MDQGHLVTSSPLDHSCKDPICKGGHTHGFQGQDLLGGQSSPSTTGRFWGGGLGEAGPLISWQRWGEAGAKALRQAPSWGRKREGGQSLANHGLQLLLQMRCGLQGRGEARASNFHYGGLCSHDGQKGELGSEQQIRRPWNHTQGPLEPGQRRI